MSGLGKSLSYRTCCAALAAALVAWPAAAAERVALLIGNSDYALDDLDLPNPVNDALALGAALGGLGFRVIEATDQDLAGMRDALARFEVAASGAEVALFFYAGHGVQYAGDNLLIGTGFGALDTAGMVRASLPMREVRTVLERARPGAGLILLDACRDSPFGTGENAAKGLVRTGGGAGLLIAYATDPGNVAFDGTGRNSVFTKALLNNIATPGLDVRLMLGRVRQDVVVETFGQQVPWVEEALIGEHVLADVKGDEIPTDADAAELALWAVAEGGDARALRDYVNQYPAGTFAETAQARLADLDGAGSVPASLPDAFRAEPRARLEAALAALGLPGGVEAAAARYAAQQDAKAELRPAALYQDATRASMALAATTAQRLRTDLVALRGIDRLARLSENALTEIREIATRDPDAAAPVLAQAERDFEDIRRSRQRVLVRLDQSREYYNRILTRAALFVPDGATEDLLAAGTEAGVDGKLRADAALFLKHVRQSADPSRKGTYSWLTDFLAQG
ncbi:caspase family protein [Albidovulum sediminicola]|nr:caspase family protein [Defluviimonas sp. WL0075]